MTPCANVVASIRSDTAAMSTILPPARMGVILSSGNRTVESYFRAFGPERLGLHFTRMRMGSGGKQAREVIEADAIACAGLLADAAVDLIDLQATGIMMERGPDGEAEVVRAIEDATGIAAFTATQSVVAALSALAIKRVILVNPYDEASIARETAYLEAAGFTIVHAVGLGFGEKAGEVAPGEWVAAAEAHDRADGDGIFLSGSNTTMLEAVVPIEQALAKPAVTSIQAALWDGTRRLAAKLGHVPPQPALGRLSGVS